MQNKSEHIKDKTIKLVECFEAKNWSKLWLKEETKITWIGGNHPKISKCFEVTWLSAKTIGVEIWKGDQIERSSKEK